MDKLAQEKKIHLRTGCFCNIGACQLYLKHLKSNFTENFKSHGHKCGDHIDLIDNKPTGAVRISFGYASTKNDIDVLIEFLNETFVEKTPSFERLISRSDKSIKKHYFKILHLLIYPIKSCAPMSVDVPWPLYGGGLLYDRNWIITDSSLVALSQKRIPSLTRVKPYVDLRRNVLVMSHEDEQFELNLNQSKPSTASSSLGEDEGDDVSNWLTRVLKLKENCRLIRIRENKNSFAYKGDFLLINETSIQKLRQFLTTDGQIPMTNDQKLVDYFLEVQFRPNFVISTQVDGRDGQDESTIRDPNQITFEEEQWNSLKILNRSLEFKVDENCSRCRVININQNFIDSSSTSNEPDQDLSKYCSALLKELYRLKSNSKFGIYISRTDSCKHSKKSMHDLYLNGNDDKLLDLKKNQICVGDVGVGYLGNITSNDSPNPENND